MNDLRLGAIPDEKPVKCTVELPGALYRTLCDYAQVHAAQTGAPPLAPERLIAPMMERFMASDRAFARLRRTLPRT